MQYRRITCTECGGTKKVLNSKGRSEPCEWCNESGQITEMIPESIDLNPRKQLFQD